MRTLQANAFIERDSEMEISALYPDKSDSTVTLRFGRSHTSNTTFFFDNPDALAALHKRLGDWLESRAPYAGLIAEGPLPAEPVTDDEFPF